MKFLTVENEKYDIVNKLFCPSGGNGRYGAGRADLNMLPSSFLRRKSSRELKNIARNPLQSGMVMFDIAFATYETEQIPDPCYN